MRTVISGDLTYVWNGSHTCNIYDGMTEVDCFTFAWEKDKPHETDFWNALTVRWNDEG